MRCFVRVFHPPHNVGKRLRVSRAAKTMASREAEFFQNIANMKPYPVDVVCLAGQDEIRGWLNDGGGRFRKAVSASCQSHQATSGREPRDRYSVNPTSAHKYPILLSDGRVDPKLYSSSSTLVGSVQIQITSIQPVQFCKHATVFLPDPGSHIRNRTGSGCKGRCSNDGTDAASKTPPRLSGIWNSLHRMTLGAICANTRLSAFPK
jgi:hypothetical protein